MKAIYFSLLSVGTLCATAPAQDLDDPALPRQRFGFSVPTWIKAGARFTGARATDPGATPSTPATLADGRVNRTYDDGFNRVNSVGNPVLVGAPRTSFFEYDNQSQVTATTLALHSVALNGGDYTRKLDNQPVPGLEMFFHRDWLGGKRWQLGWEFGASYALFQWRQNGSPNSSVNLLTDQFNLNGVPLSSPGVAGPYTPVPGVTYIGSTPTRTEAIVPASVTGTRQLEMHTLQLRLGPTLDWQPLPRWTLGVQGGLLVGAGWSQLAYAEQITVAAANISTLNQSGRSHDEHLWGGFFSAARLAYQLNARWDAHVEVRRLWQDKQHHNGPARSAEISLGDAFGLAAGVDYRF